MIKRILKKYNIDGDLISYERYGSGNINKTFLAVTSKNKYLIQQINDKVFTKPYKLMENIESITDYLKDKIDENHKVLELIKTKDNKCLCYIINEEGDREYYRIYEYIDNTISYDNTDDRDIIFNTGRAFGNFLKLLKDYDLDNLWETIKDFHDTYKRYKRLLCDIEVDRVGRVGEVKKEIEFIKKREKYCSLIMDKLKDGSIPYRVTHNDTKVNNVLMDKDTKQYVAVIDLDTVMKGTMLFDYGDGIRSSASTVSEAETNLDRIYLDMDLFKSYTDGYLSETAKYLTDCEVSLMAEGVHIILIEQCIRFIDDYINGDTYFRIEYEKHNLDRARNQMKLLEDVENHLKEMKEYIYRSYRKYR